MFKFLSNLFKSKSENLSQSKFEEPPHLKGIVKKLSSEENEKLGKFNPKIEWRGKIQLNEKESYFLIKYFGIINKDGFISEKDNLPPIISIENSTSENPIVIYDKSQHGYDGGITQSYKINIKEEILNSRKVSHFLNLENETKFKIYLSIFYNHDYEMFIQNIENEIQNDQLILPLGNKINTKEAFRNSFDFLRIVVESESGKLHEIIHDELA